MTTQVKPIYQWAEGSRIPKRVEAQAVGEQLERLAGSTGITPDRVVDAARDPRSPMHPVFEWDDEVAGEEWRKQQARMLLKSVRVVMPDASSQIAYVSVLVGDDRAYMPHQVVAESPTYREFALRDALRYLTGFEARYRQLDALRPVLDAIRRVRESMQLTA